MTVPADGKAAAMATKITKLKASSSPQKIAYKILQNSKFFNKDIKSPNNKAKISPKL